MYHIQKTLCKAGNICTVSLCIIQGTVNMSFPYEQEHIIHKRTGDKEYAGKALPTRLTVVTKHLTFARSAAVDVVEPAQLQIASRVPLSIMKS
jgi:hypothetical protein